MKNMRTTEALFMPRPTMWLVLSAVATLCSTPCASSAGTLPSGGNFIAGNGSISGSGTSLTINQNSSRGVIDWTSFSIGNGASVTFNNGTGATLNRVTGANPSSILGSLTATGSLYLINPQGIVIGTSGTISTGGRFVASTLDADDTAFMNGGPLTFAGSSNATVVNLGKIGSTNGDVILVAAKEVDNEGSITAPNGSAELATGSQVLLQDSSSNRQVFVQTGSGGTVSNTGAIEAAQISLQAADGNVFALSGNHEVLRASGTATRDGHIWLVADTGSVTLAGQIDAKKTDGSGGTVDTIASNLAFDASIPTVSAGIWNITTPSFTVGDSAALSFSRSLSAGTSINLQTTGTSGQTGDIDVASSINWNGAASLDLGAFHSITVDKGATIKNQGTGNLALHADSTAIDNNGSVTNLGTIDWSHSTGIVQAYFDYWATTTGSYAPGLHWSNAAWTPPAGSGVQKQFTGYNLVNTLTDLQAVNHGLSANFALGRDIDASATSDGNFVPLGTSTVPFTGIFDGMGHQITALTLMKPVAYLPPQLPHFEAIQGLFGEIQAGALVRNLSVSGANYFGSGTNGEAYGILAGINFGTIDNVHTSGMIFGENSRGWVGGLVGWSTGTVLDSSSSASIYDALGAGGLVGYNQGGITRSYATGAVNSKTGAGGLVEYSTGSIVQSYATGPVYVNGSYDAGGLVADNGGTIAQSYATGSVAGGEYVGGLVGSGGGSITQSFATGALATVSSTVDFVGGVAGTISPDLGADLYWNVQSTGSNKGSGDPYDPVSIPATNGLTTAQMRTPSSFVGYDFGPNGVWAMPAGATHPVLAWQVNPQ